MAFAKLFERENNQILVKMDIEDGVPEVRFYFKPEDLGVCNAAISYKDDSDESRNKCETFFKDITEDEAFEFVERIMSYTNGETE
jgi:hypothetical protein